MSEKRPRWELIAPATGVAGWEWDLAGDTLVCDEPLLRVLGFPAAGPGSAAAGQSSADLTFADLTARLADVDGRRLVASIDRAVAVLGEFEEVVRLAALDGAERHVRVVGRVLPDEAGSAATVVGAVVPVSSVGQDLERLRLLSDVSELLSATLDQGIGVRELAGLVVPQLADWCIVTVEATDGLSRDLGWAHRDPAADEALGSYARQQYVTMSPEAAVSVCLRTGEPVIVREMPPALLDAWIQEDSARTALDLLAPGSVAVLPLNAGGRTLGAMALVTLPGRGPQTSMELELAGEVARRAGLALDNARLHGRLRGLVGALQRSLLTAVPEVAGLEVAVRYVPAAEEAQVGGDWYDVYHQPDGTAVIVIGDVIGHDSQAAAAMGQLRGLLRGIGYATGDRPSGLLRRLDEAMAGLRSLTTATAIVAAVGAEAPLSLRFSNAGHLPPVTWDPGTPAAAVERDEPDLLLGIDPGTERAETAIPLTPGSTVILYTDGLVEQRGVSLEDGIGRLLREVDARAAGPLDALCDGLLTAMLPAEPEDDVALVVLRVPETTA